MTPFRRASASSTSSELSNLSSSPDPSSELQKQLDMLANHNESQGPEQGALEKEVKESPKEVIAEENGDGETAKTSSTKQKDPNEHTELSSEILADRSKYEATTKYLLENANSPLAEADILKHLARPDSWDVLTDDEKEELRALLPPEMLDIDPITGSTRPSNSFLLSEPMRDAVTLFKENLMNGYYAPAYLRRAAIAMEERRQGKFDEIPSSDSL